jgi:hypothetical protein
MNNIILTPKDLREANDTQCWNTECPKYTVKNRSLCKKHLEDGECEDRYQFTEQEGFIGSIAQQKLIRWLFEPCKEHPYKATFWRKKGRYVILDCYSKRYRCKECMATLRDNG